MCSLTLPVSFQYRWRMAPTGGTLTPQHVNLGFTGTPLKICNSTFWNLSSGQWQTRLLVWFACLVLHTEQKHCLKKRKKIYLKEQTDKLNDVVTFWAACRNLKYRMNTKTQIILYLSPCKKKFQIDTEVWRRSLLKTK